MNSTSERAVIVNDYLYATGRVRSLERTLLTRERASRMIDARAMEDAVKILAECGYSEWPMAGSGMLPVGWEGLLAGDMAASLRLVAAMSPDPRLMDVLSLPYDYHNAKVLVKLTATGREPSGRLLSDAGCVPSRRFLELYRAGGTRDLPGRMGEAITDAADVLARTEDPQLGDFILDRACFADMLVSADKLASPFVIGYVRLRADVANLRSVVRAGRSHHGPELLRYALIPGGLVAVSDVLSVVGGGGTLLESFGTQKILQPAVEAALPAMRRETGLSDFERHCDDAAAAFFSGVHLVPFGPEPVLAYAAAREREPVTLRTIFSGREAGLSSTEIRSRLRGFA